MERRFNFQYKNSVIILGFFLYFYNGDIWDCDLRAINVAWRDKKCMQNLGVCNCFNCGFHTIPPNQEFTEFINIRPCYLRCTWE
jgi:hypothetical protein